MYVVMRGVEGPERSASGVIESALEGCMALTGLTSAFVAVERQRQGRSTLSIRARSSTDEQQRGWRLSPSMRWALQTAIETASPTLTTGRRRSRAEAYPHVLIATPIMSGGHCRAALAAMGHIPAPYTATIRSMRRFARMLNVDELIADSTSPQPEDFMRTASARQDILLHELRVPLSAAALVMERLASQRSDGRHVDPSGDLAHAAHLAILEAQSIVRHFSQLQALNQDNLTITTRPLKIQAIIERAVALLPGAKGRLRLSAPEGLPDVAADPLWLTHVLTNLLENAITYTPPPNKTDVSAALSSDGRRIVISITSYGAGIPLTEQASVLIPRRRRAAKDDLTSKGLGLSIAKHLVTAMRGDIWVESDGLRSATFHVALPFANHKDD